MIVTAKYRGNFGYIAPCIVSCSVKTVMNQRSRISRHCLLRRMILLGGEVGWSPAKVFVTYFWSPGFFGHDRALQNLKNTIGFMHACIVYERKPKSWHHCLLLWSLPGVTEPFPSINYVLAWFTMSLYFFVIFIVSYEEKDLNFTWRSKVESDIFIYDNEMAQFDIVSAKRYLKHKVYHSGKEYFILKF